MPQTLQGPKALAFARPLLLVGQGDERIRVLLGLRSRALVVAVEAQRRAQGWACCPAPGCSSMCDPPGSACLTASRRRAALGVLGLYGTSAIKRGTWQRARKGN